MDFLTIWFLTDFPVLIYFVLQQINTWVIPENQMESALRLGLGGLAPAPPSREEMGQNGFILLPCSPGAAETLGRELSPSQSSRLEETTWKNLSRWAWAAKPAGLVVMELSRGLGRVNLQQKNLTHIPNLCLIPWKRSCWGRRKETYLQLCHRRDGGKVPQQWAWGRGSHACRTWGVLGWLEKMKKMKN